MADDRDQPISQLRSELAALQQVLGALAGLPDAQRALRAQLADKEQRLAALLAARASASGGPVIAGPTHASRDVNIATHQRITYLSTIVYGPDPSAEQREQLDRYLRRLAARLQRL